MGKGATIGTRSLVDTSKAAAYCAAKEQSGFAAEEFSDISGKELDALISQIDVATAKSQTSRLRMDLGDVFAMRRDLRYGQRSRKWLFLKAQQTRINSNFLLWINWALENSQNLNASTVAKLKALTDKSEKELVNIDASTLLGI
jgi:hypothetical protein